VELTMSQNEDKDRDEAAAERERIRTLFGDNALIGLATDEPARSKRPSSAQTIVKDRNKSLRELRREDRDAQLAVAAGHRADADAFDRYTADSENASEDDKRAAFQHADRAGLLPKRSSAEKLIAQDERLRRRAS
jgi:hypothetical protein